MKKILGILVASAPLVAFAQPISGFDSLVAKLTQMGNVFIQILIAFAVIWIIFNVVRFIISSEEDRAKYRSSVLWGIVGLAVILSIWGLVRLLTNTFNTGPNVQDRPGPIIPPPPRTGTL